MSRHSVRNVLLGLAAAAVLATSASAEDRHVKIINETNATIVHFYGSNAGSNSWEEDILGQDILKPGQSVNINFDDGSGYCLFDFKAEFSDGDTLIRKGIDVCKVGVYRYSLNN
jgi:hypothetical protein